MADEKFNWKSLFINDVNVEETKQEPEAQKQRTKKTISFPDSPAQPSRPVEQKRQAAPASGDKPTVDQGTLDAIIAMYVQGFESLNNPGYDFYEFFKAVEAVGSHDPQVYKMAYTMAKTVNKEVSKNQLLSKADSYIAEINKVHSQYLAQGNSKKNQIQSGMQSKKSNLTNEISDLELQMNNLKEIIFQKRTELQSIDTGMISELSEIDQKIICNDIARSKIQDEISEVVNGIKNNL
jgi:hypothetical protein